MSTAEGFPAPSAEKEESLLPPTPHLSDTERGMIEDLEGPIEKILGQLRPEIDAGKYSLVISDDASGRIPALMVGHVIKDIYEKKGIPPPMFRAIAGSSHIAGTDVKGREEKIRLIAEYLAKVRTTAAQGRGTLERALIVTDTIAEGRSIKVLLEALARNQLKADVATIGLLNLSTKSELEKDWDVRIAFGESIAPDIYKKSRLSGIYKNPNELFSSEAEWAKGSETKEARVLAKALAHRIAQEYLRHQA